MTADDARAARVKAFFDRHFGLDHRLHDLKAISSLLPDDPLDLRMLEARCLDTARKAMHAGSHLEMRRFEHLARQLAQCAPHRH